tara:strand:+ start:5413 stop:5880 length:468 start_codon:yes stop_codon:yes gene_type:complete
MENNEGNDTHTAVADTDSRLGNRDHNSIPLGGVETKNERISPLVLQTLSLAQYLRADIVCQFSNERPCGYLIRPQIWFLRMTEPIKNHLVSIGVKPQKRYTKAGDITKILHSIKQIESIIKNPQGLHLVKHLNGILRQPSTHEEVLKALDLIEQS